MTQSPRSRHVNECKINHKIHPALRMTVKNRTAIFITGYKTNFNG